MPNRIDTRTCKRCQSKLIRMTTEGTSFMCDCPEYADEVREAVLCIKWLLERVAKLEGKQ